MLAAEQQPLFGLVKSDDATVNKSGHESNPSHPDRSLTWSMD